MKTDRIMFGLACLGLGYLAHTSMNIDSQKDCIQEEIKTSMPKMKPELSADTALFTKYAKQDSIKLAQDSLKKMRTAIK